MQQNMEHFKHFMLSVGLSNPDELSFLLKMADSLSFKKEEIIVAQNEFHSKECFVESGVVRSFIIDDSGNEKTVAFFESGEFMSTLVQRTNDNQSIYFYQALCNSVVLAFPSNRLKGFLSGEKHLALVGKRIKEEESRRSVNRNACILQTNAEDRYLNFVRHYPRLERYISQKHIASYIGISPVSLSRVKKGLIRKYTSIK